MNTPPIFLSFSEVVEIHRYQIDNFGGALGIRDVNLLRSALGMPKATFGGSFLHSDLYEMAAAYLFHLTQNHPFIDGNKRVGAMAALIFLDLNGVEFSARPEELTAMVYAVARDQAQKSEITQFLRQNSTILE